MEKREPDTSGDYGYDLAHEAARDQQGPATPAPARPGSTSHASGTADRGQDYAYDEAHDF